MIEAITTGGILSLALFLLRNWIVTRLKTSILHEYDNKLEKLRSQLRQHESKMDSIRSTLFSNAAHRDKLVFTKKVNAVEVLWESILLLSPFKVVSAMMGVVDFDKAAESAKTEQGVRDFAKAISGKVDLSDAKLAEVNKVRPFLSELSWAYFSAYRSVVMNAVLRAKFLESGLPAELLNDKAVKELVTTVYPHMKDFINKHDSAILHEFLSDLERDILTEINKTLSGKESDEQSFERAKEIIDATQELEAAAKEKTP